MSQRIPKQQLGQAFWKDAQKSFGHLRFLSLLIYKPFQLVLTDIFKYSCESCLKKANNRDDRLEAENVPWLLEKVKKIGILPRPCSTYVELQLLRAFWHIFTLLFWKELYRSFRIKYFWAFFWRLERLLEHLENGQKSTFDRFYLVKPSGAERPI